VLACLGGAVADATLTIGAWRGVVISGGIVPQLRTLVAQSSFAARFYQKGQMQALLSQVPVWLSVDPFAGLRGAQLAFSNPHMADAITSDGTVRPNQLEPGREAS
jgi:glucokinase